MSQDNKSSNADNQKQHAEPAEGSLKEGDVGMKSAEEQIWAAAIRLARDDKEPFLEKQEYI
jgi:hypothetical protein